MIQISNSQRDEICRHLRTLLDLIKDNRDNASRNVRRRAGKLLRILLTKTALPATSKDETQDPFFGNM